MEDDDRALNKEEGFEELTITEQFDKFFHFITEKDLNTIQKDTIEKVVNELEGEDK